MSNFSYKVFSTVISKKTFYQTAKTLNVTPSAVSHSINQLEQDLGFPLFIRDRSGVELTADGNRVLPFIQKILNDESNLRQVSDSIKGLNSGSVRFGVFSSVCINWLPHIIQEFKANFPDIKISVKQGNIREINEWTRNGRIDIGFTLMPAPENLLVYPLINDPIYCITPADFNPINGSFITRKDVRNENFILQQRDYDQDTKLALDYYNVTANSLQFSIDDQSIISMVESGLGLGILPELALKKLSGNFNYFNFSKKYERKISLIVNKNQSTAPSIAKMIQIIKNFLRTEYSDRLLWV